jgi:hypothetical protein
MLLLVLFFAFFAHPCCETNEWNGIIPLKSTRADVEKLLGKAPGSSNNTAQYKTRNENIFVVYANDPCTTEKSRSGNSQSALVVILEITPFVPQKLSDLKLDEGRFKKTLDETRNEMYMTNTVDGITITQDPASKSVTKISLSPEKTFADKFCKQDQ